MLEHIIFDFDGVIHDTFELAFVVGNQLHGYDREEYKQMFEGNLYNHHRIKNEDINEYFRLSKEKFKDLVIEQHVRDELLRLSEKFNLIIVSSNSEEILNDYLKNNDIVKIFTKVLGVETHKSKQEKFKMLENDHNVSSENSIFVTDTLGDILEANKAGLRTVAVDFGYHERARLERGSPLQIISDFRDLRQFLGKFEL